MSIYKLRKYNAGAQIERPIKLIPGWREGWGVGKRFALFFFANRMTTPEAWRIRAGGI